MRLIYEKIQNTDLSSLIPLISRQGFKELINAPAGQEHYKLLGYISLILNHANIVELGTHNGTSSLALSINNTNHIRTYDVIDIYSIIKQPLNVTRIIGNIFDINEEHFLLNADFIFLDTAHTGDFEWQVYKYLYDNNYRGIIIYDDIHWSNEMIHFWNKIIDTTKYDITDIGHGAGKGPLGNISGTGLVDFNNQVEIII